MVFRRGSWKRNRFAMSLGHGLAGRGVVMVEQKVLVAEDEAAVRDLYRSYLRRNGFDVVVAANGKEAVALFFEERPDAVCLDLLMPVMSGFDACRAIREVDQQVPILFLSGHDDLPSKVEGLEIGADDYVIKPISPSELVARLKAVLRRAKASDPSFMFGENCVDRIARRCEYGKKVAKLSLRELQILEFLYRNPNRVVSREELYREVWAKDSLSGSRLVDQQLLVLRKKLHGDHVIDTVYGRGYRYTAPP